MRRRVSLFSSTSRKFEEHSSDFYKMLMIKSRHVASLTRMRSNVSLQQRRSVELFIAAVARQPRLLLPAHHRNSIFVLHFHIRVHLDGSDVTGRMWIFPGIRICVWLIIDFRLSHVDYVFRLLLTIKNNYTSWPMSCTLGKQMSYRARVTRYKILCRIKDLRTIFIFKSSEHCVIWSVFFILIYDWYFKNKKGLSMKNVADN